MGYLRCFLLQPFFIKYLSHFMGGCFRFLYAFLKLRACNVRPHFRHPLGFKVQFIICVCNIAEGSFGCSFLCLIISCWFSALHVLAREVFTVLNGHAGLGKL